ncbi:MAG: tripartite tricarboxylate transporter substrate binding protein [Alcaligenaceae bacterium]|nr:tripartite tricarboxylate transporter substrate binding protein [Alcaligenaceae bacterium]
MARRQLASIFGVFALSVFAIGPAQAADSYPSKPIRLIVPFSAGASSDISARRVSEVMARTLGQPIVVENIPGAGGVVGIQKFLQQPSDGYTLLAGSISTHGINPHIHSALPYDPIKDFAPISRISSFPNILVVHPSLNVKTLPELVEKVKEAARDGKPLTYASGGKGSTSHLGGEQLKQAAGAELTHVPYSSVSVAMPDFLSGRVPIMFGNMTVVQPFIEKGTIVAIANTGERRSNLLPELKTVEEQGFRNMQLSAWIGLFAKAGTPPEVLKKLNAAATKAVASEEVKKTFDGLGKVAESDESAEHFAEFVRKETEKWGAVVKAANIQEQ